MKRSGPLKRMTALRRRTALRPVSAKQQALNIERRTFVADYLGRNPMCGFASIVGGTPCGHYADHVHEVLTRARGGSILDEDNVVGLCAGCHRYVHDHPAKATEFGLLRPSWTRGEQTMSEEATCDRCGRPGVEPQIPPRRQTCTDCDIEIGKRCREGAGRCVERMRCQWCRDKTRSERRLCGVCLGEGSRDVVFTDVRDERDWWHERDERLDRRDYELDTAEPGFAPGAGR